MKARSPDEKLARRLRTGETLYGLLTKMPNPATVELAGHVGFDLVVIDTEHGSADADALEHHLRAADAADIEALVRVGTMEPIEALRALDAGAKGIIFPHVNDAETARSAVHTAHYPPLGKRGLAVSTRAGSHGASSTAMHIEDALENTLVVVQVEHAEALNHVLAIASTEHVDAVFLGPSDLSLSLGHPGNLSHPKVIAAIDQVARTVVEVDGVALCVLAGSEREARVWEERGARLVLFSATALMGERFRWIVSQLRPDRKNAADPRIDKYQDGRARRNA